MGADSQMPYLYTPSSQHSIAYPHSNFNPKAVTEASYKRLSQQTQASSRPKQEGPLINFNQHPDNYVVFDGQRAEFKPLPKKTKQAIVAVRWTQFGMRLLQEIAALGLLAATTCLKGTTGAETYLLRVPQAWDSLITLYAIYHLLRAAKGRTPASSVSYHTFALIMDTLLIPLYVYIALLANNNRQLPLPQYDATGQIISGDWRFTSMFPAQSATDYLLLATFIGAAVLGGLHLLSCGLDLYLIITFRQISNLPPDMNPLEDNLTSRRSRSTKHKYKNSELTVDTAMSEEDRKKMAHMSGSTLSVANQSRLSVATKSDGGDRIVPFNHSRTGSNSNLAFSPHNPDSARWSRHQYDGQQSMYQEAVSSPRRSRYEIRPDGKLEIRSRRDSQSPSKREPVLVETTEMSGRSRRDVFASPHGEVDPDTIGRALSPDLPHAAVPLAGEVKKEQSSKLLNDNWYILDAEEEEYDISRGNTPANAYGNTTAPVSRFSAAAAAMKGGYVPAPIHERHDSFTPAATAYQSTATTPRPLGMHPPTPPLADSEYPDPDEQRHNTSIERNPTAASQMTNASSIYSESAPSLKSSKGTPKGKYYGNLAAATRGVRGDQQQQSLTHMHSPLPPLPGGYSARDYGHGYGLPPSPQASRTPSPEKQARVVSRTGADIADESVLYLHPEDSNSRFSMRSRRDVSGKVAEEGRGSWR